MTVTINKRRLTALAKKPLRHGAHPASSREMCFMEAAAWIADEPWTDHPECVCLVIGTFCRSWNDALPIDGDRDRLLKPLLPLVVGTRSTSEVQMRRSWMALDWSIRVCAPAWLDFAGLSEDAAALRALPEITNSATATASRKALNAAKTRAAAAWDAAGDAARDAAGDAARVAAWAAAGDAAWVAAGNAAWDAARVSARVAAWDAAGNAARDAARDAAWAAARAAARDALAPTVLTLQESAVDLVKRMCAVS